MEWSDEGIVLQARRHGEGDLVATLMTFGHGRHAGLVRGGASRRQLPQWQTGNRLEVSWQARIVDQLGSFRAEMLEPFAARLMIDPLRLAAMAAACGMIDATLPERQNYDQLYAALLHLIRRLDVDDWPSDYVRFELILLEGLGFGLQLDRCAVTDSAENLTHVSPRTGRAVSADAAEPYLDKLLPLPSFLQTGHVADANEIAQGLKLAGFFFWRHVFEPADRGMPVARDRLASMLIPAAAEESGSTGDDRRA